MRETAENVAERLRHRRARIRTRSRSLAASARAPPRRRGCFAARDRAGDHARSRSGEPRRRRPTTSIRRDTTLEALAKLQAAPSGPAAPSPPATPRASTTAPARADRSRRAGGARASACTPLARVVATAAAGVEPAHHGHRPGAGDAQARSSAPGCSIGEIDLIELNEAFAAQALAVHARAAASTRERVNVNGGAIALGHPLGSTGAPARRHARARAAPAASGRYGLATMCIGVGQGLAVVLERAA